MTAIVILGAAFLAIILVMGWLIYVPRCPSCGSWRTFRGYSNEGRGACWCAKCGRSWFAWHTSWRKERR